MRKWLKIAVFKKKIVPKKDQTATLLVFFGIKHASGIYRGGLRVFRMYDKSSITKNPSDCATCPPLYKGGVRKDTQKATYRHTKAESYVFLFGTIKIRLLSLNKGNGQGKMKYNYLF